VASPFVTGEVPCPAMEIYPGMSCPNGHGWLAL
jgi:hypothetical protein